MLLAALLWMAPAWAQYDPQHVPFDVQVDGHTLHHSIASLFVLPGDTLTLSVASNGRDAAYTFSTGTVESQALSPRKFRLVAPGAHGVYELDLQEEGTDHHMLIRLWVMIPYTELKGEYLNGYRIGKYPRIPYRQLPQYRPPRGFVEVTDDNEQLQVSPHFRVGDFLCKQNGDYPKYLVLREALLLKLELILKKVNDAGYPCTTFAILSGFRTPYYNKAIGNVQYSRHLWGGAADIYIDEDPQDEMMDDLNGDGKSDWRDAAIVYDLIDDMYGEEYYKPFVGGLGRYKRTRDHGPFVHVDVRGFRARWGD